MEAPKSTRDFAKGLRQKLDLPEAMLWSALRRRQLDGLHFRRQHPIGRYILDFYCDEAKLAVEVDGYSHDVADRPERDRVRDEWIAACGIRTFRVPARDVLRDLDSVLTAVLAAARG